MKYLLLLLFPISANAADVTFVWQDTNPTGTEFNLYCDGSRLNTALIPDKTFTHTLTSGVEHTCQATAVYNQIESEPSVPLVFTIPNPPTGINVTVNISFTL